MDQPSSLGAKTVPPKPIAGLVIVLFVSTVIGGWLYVDYVRGELERRILALEAQAAQQSKLMQSLMRESDQGRMTNPTSMNSWHTVQGSLGEHRFQLDLPPGYSLRIGEGMMGNVSAYVMMDQASDNETPTPDMVIGLVSLENQQYASKLGKDEPGTRLVATPQGKFGFWITGWEDLSWEPFDAVAATFKAL